VVTVEGARNDNYVLLGEVYVHALMHGEMFEKDANAVRESIILQ
jgi:hypothetical protein